MAFQLESNYKPRGDQAQAIAKLLKSVEAGGIATRNFLSLTLMLR